MIKAVFWDFGGVLTTSPFLAFSRFEEAQGIPKGTLRKINATNPDTNAWARFESNQITLDEFDQAFAEEAKNWGYDLSGKTVIALLSGDLVPEMVEVLRRCGTHYKTACLTNNVQAGKGAGMQSSAQQAAQVQQVMEMFDFVMESSKIGIRKPNPQFYKIACEEVGVAPNEVVYLDDLGINLKPARAMGMKTIKVHHPSQAMDELQSYLEISLK